MDIAQISYVAGVNIKFFFDAANGDLIPRFVRVSTFGGDLPDKMAVLAD